MTRFAIALIPSLSETNMQQTPVLEVKNLRTAFRTEGGQVVAVDDVSFSVLPGQTIGIVGESGCGKSVTSLSIMGLIPSPPGKVIGGEINFKGKNLLTLNSAEMRKIRGNEISMIFQEPMTSLNPVLTIGVQIAENVVRRMKLGWRAAMDRAVLGNYVADQFRNPLMECLEAQLVVSSGLKIDKLDDLEAMIARASAFTGVGETQTAPFASAGRYWW